MTTKQINEVPADSVESAGYLKFNGGPHLCVDVPDGHYTISLRFPNGKGATVAYIPGRANCIDVCVGKASDRETQKVIVFGPGGTPYHWSSHKEASEYERPTLTTFLLEE